MISLEIPMVYPFSEMHNYTTALPGELSDHVKFVTVVIDPNLRVGLGDDLLQKSHNCHHLS